MSGLSMLVDRLERDKAELREELERVRGERAEAIAHIHSLLATQRSIFVAWARWSEDGDADAAESLSLRTDAMREARAFLARVASTQEPEKP